MYLPRNISRYFCGVINMTESETYSILDYDCACSFEVGKKTHTVYAKNICNTHREQLLKEMDFGK